jgi:hypothetical protein
MALPIKYFARHLRITGKRSPNRLLVAQVADMHLGMSRGPQLSSSAGYSVITAMDKAGNIHWFKLNNGAKTWQPMGVVNDLKGSAPEGLMSITADNKDNFYAVWLDTRLGGKNQVWFSSLSGKSTKWSDKPPGLQIAGRARLRML